MATTDKPGSETSVQDLLARVDKEDISFIRLWFTDILGQLGDQALAALVAPLYAFGMTFLLLKGLSLVMPLRVTEYEEALGMDTVAHGEEAYPTGEGAILVSPEAGMEAEVPVAQPT